MITYTDKQLITMIEVVEEIPRWHQTLNLALGGGFGDRLEQLHDSLMLARSQSEKYYYKIEEPEVRRKIKEFKLEMADFEKECQERRKNEMMEDLYNKEKELEELFEKEGNLEKKEQLLKEARKLEQILKSKITPEMIENAREYPLKNIIEIDSRNFAVCVAHDDKAPSMYCKGNYAHCFSCGYTGDPIDVYRKVKNASFQEAIWALQ